MRPHSVLLAVAAGLALADASIVTLALPQLLVDLHTTVVGVAAVIGVYTVVLAVTLVPLERLTRRSGAPRVGAIGFALFAAASLLCGSADSLAVLLSARALQAAGGAAALVATFSLLTIADDPTPPSARTLWLGAAVLSAALGPVLGGALAQAFSWPAIFFAQAPVAAAAAVLCLQSTQPTLVAQAPTHLPVDKRAACALGLLSAALSAILFLLVLLLVAGWAVHPLAAAATVTVVPAAAVVAARIRGDARWRAAVGCLLVGLGTLALAYLPDARLAWTIAPQALAGLGMGLALPALAGELLPERDARDAALLLRIRYLGIALALAVIAPVTALRLEHETEQAREHGVALALDAKLAPTRKLELAPALLASVNAESPRAVLRQTIATGRSTISPDEQPEYDQLATGADRTLVDAVGDAFFAAFAITGLLAVIAAALLVPRHVRVPAWVVGATVLAGGVLTVQVVEWHRLAPTPVHLADPCLPRQLPATGGVGGFLQDRTLKLLDASACRYGSSREALVLALADEDDAERFQHEHGVNPRSIGAVLRNLLG